MKRTRTILALLLLTVILICGCGRTRDDNGVPADSVISQTALTPSPQPDTESIPSEKDASSDSSLSAEEQRNVPVIYLILPTETGLSAQAEDVILKRARRAGYDVIVKTHEGEPDKQTKAFEEAALCRAAAVICDNISGDRVKTDMAIAREAGIPVFLMNRGIPDDGVPEGQVRTDRNGAMVELAEYFARHNRLHETYALIYNANNSSENLYVASFRRKLTEYENMKESTEAGLVDLDVENVKSVLRSELSANSEIDTFVCGSGAEAVAVSEALKALELQKEIICLNGDIDNMPDLVRDGICYAAVIQPAELMAEKTMEAVLAHLTDGAKTGTAYVPGVVIANSEPEKLEDILREIAEREAEEERRRSYEEEEYNYSGNDNDNEYSDSSNTGDTESDNDSTDDSTIPGGETDPEGTDPGTDSGTESGSGSETEGGSEDAETFAGDTEN